MATQLVSIQRGHSGDVKMMNLTGLGLTGDAPQTTIDTAFRYVPWFRRACKLRANAIGRFPLALDNERGEDVSELPEYQAVMGWTRQMLYRIGMNIVKYGACYHLLESNRFGLNITPRFIPTNTCYPIIDYKVYGVTGFRIAFVQDAGEFPLDRVVWIWEPNDESEIAPGPSDGAAGLKAAGLLYAIDEMANRYMTAGGVPVTAVRVPATVDTKERTKIESWFAQFAGGFRNFMKFLVVNKDTEFETIGSEIKDMEATELTASQRDNVAVAMGVPPTVLDGKSANYATAESEMTGFYINTVIPEAEMLEPALNTQLYQRLGLTLRFKPDELEVMQAIQLSQAQGVTALVGKPVLSINEGREIIEYEPIGTKGDWPTEEPTPAVPPPATPETAAPIAESDELAVEPLDEGDMKAWLKASLDSLKAGNSPAIGTPFDAELANAGSGNAIRRIFESHWPRKAPSLEERAVIALEQYTALSQSGGSRNGRNVHKQRA